MYVLFEIIVIPLLLLASVQGFSEGIGNFGSRTLLGDITFFIGVGLTPLIALSIPIALVVGWIAHFKNHPVSRAVKIPLYFMTVLPLIWIYSVISET